MMYLYVYLSNVVRDLKEEAGQGMAEYGLILALVALAAIAALTAVGTQLDVKFDEIVTKLGGTASE